MPRPRKPSSVPVRGSTPAIALTSHSAEGCRALQDLSAGWAKQNQAWSNWGIIDSPETFLGFLPTPKLFRPTNAYEVSRAVRQAEAAEKTIRALGSGWSFSDAVLPQSLAIQGEEQQLFGPTRVLAEAGALNEAALTAAASHLTSHFGYAIDTTTLDRSLQALLPSVLEGKQDASSFFFVEAGMTIDFLNILLDSQPDKQRLALKTMGGASAQTVAGAISTGTHGGDFDRPPLADNVRAIYLIGKGGVHHWVEPANAITDRAKIRAVFPCITEENIHYDDGIFRAALVSIGAMGVIYAVILDVVPQYSLLQFNSWTTWNTLREAVRSDPEKVFSGEYSGLTKYLSEQFPKDPPSPNRFLRS